jgi:small-conductance mechanosensitive channel
LRLVAILWLLLASEAVARQDVKEPELDSAPVIVDGEALFRVRGVEAFPAVERAANIAAKIEALAADESFHPEMLRAHEQGDVTEITGGSLVILRLTNEDAGLESVQRSLLAVANMERIRRAIEEYRVARSRASLIVSGVHVVVGIAAGAALLALLLWVLRLAEVKLRSGLDRRAGRLAAESRQILHFEHIGRLLHGVLGFGRTVIGVFVVLLLLQYVLIQFPWTRGAGRRLFGYVWDPLAAAGTRVVQGIPNIVVLVVLIFIARYVLSLVRLYFDAIHRGSIHLRHFEPEWAPATHNLVRVVVIVSALVIAYPYVPGSQSDAFKGVSLLVGLVLSLGSTSAMSNIVAGYMILFRSAFRVGDVVKIGDMLGRVTEMRLQVTHARTVKNEEITIPNSVILGSEVTNYSKPAREQQLILHMEAMLIEAARRTPDLRAEPAPFVLQRKLGEFAITYQINAYSDRAERMQRIYSDLHSNILDLFNEHGVQIMTPAYEGDPEKPKVVAMEEWFAAPARKEDKCA